MVEKNVSGVYTEILYSPIGKTATMNGQTAISAYLPLPAGETVFSTGSTGATRHFWHEDWLGSVRFSSTVVNRTPVFDRAFAPFGEIYNTVLGGTSNPNFTGDTQDTISGEFDTHYRQLHPSQGRWISPDPAGFRAVDAMNPQTWNRYMYVHNNPLSLTDLSGLDTDLSGLNIDWEFNWQFPITFNGINAPQMFTFMGAGANYGTLYSTSTAATAPPSSASGQAPVPPSILLDLYYFNPSGACGNLIGEYGCSPPTPRPCQFGQGHMAFCVGAHGPANNSSWAWNFTKSFFTFAGGPGNVPTCAGQALRHMGEILNPFTPGASTAAEAAAPVAQAVA